MQKVLLVLRPVYLATSKCTLCREEFIRAFEVRGFSSDCSCAVHGRVVATFTGHSPAVSSVSSQSSATVVGLNPSALHMLDFSTAQK